MSALYQLFESIDNENQCVARRTRSRKVISKLPDLHPFVSASDLQNFCMDDHFADFLDLYISPPDPHPLQALFELGIEFEQRMIQQLRQITGMDLPRLSSRQTSRLYSVADSHTDFDMSIACMKRGDPILYSPYLWCPNDKLHGIPDILVRNDALHWFNLQNLPDRPSSFGNYFYVPIEVKFSSLNRVRNNQYLSNAGRLRYYKTQLMMYSRLLHQIQGVFPCVAYIIGKRFVDSDGSVKPAELTELGKIDFVQVDKIYSDLYDQAIAWMRRVKTEGRTWNIGTMPRELQPNMKAVHPYHQSMKSEWAVHLRDITQVWRCTSFHRDNARRWKIYTWDDPRCTAEKLGISEAYRQTVDDILTVNRSPSVSYLPRKLPLVVCPYGPVDSCMYVDFETIANVFNDDAQEERIFLIGAWYRGEYHHWLMNQNTAEEEYRIMREFAQFWTSSGKPTCLYWFAEKSFWNRALSRHSDNLDEVEWTDLYEPWVSQKIVIKGALNFKLKTLIRALLQLGFTNVELPPAGCSDGLEAMHLAIENYSQNDRIGTDGFADIVHYNCLDCIYVQELYRFITFLKSSRCD